MRDEYGIDQVREVLRLMAQTAIANSDTFTEIDSRLGDGDMGLSMQKGAAALIGALDKPQENIASLLKECAMVLNRNAPSTLGTLLSGAMLSAAKWVGPRETLTGEQVAQIPTVLADAIALRGKAKEGDKTILDALYPYARAFLEVYQRTQSLAEAKAQAHQAAHAGMEGTKGRPAGAGRAKWLGERNMDWPDGGAVLCDVIALALCSGGESDEV